jgi:putative ABC transport system substrate-binding protein
LQLKNLYTASETLGVQLHVLHANTEREFDSAFTALSQLRAAGLVFTSDPYFANRASNLLRSRCATPCPRLPSRATSRWLGA